MGLIYMMWLGGDIGERVGWDVAKGKPRSELFGE